LRKAKTIRVLNLRDISLAKVEYKGSFQGIGKAYGKLMQWSRANGLTDATKNKTITIYHDDPNEVGMNNVRQSACIIVDKLVKSPEGITQSDFKPGKCAVGRFEISFFEFKNAWIEMFKWIDQNGFKASGEDSFEVYQNNSNQHPQKKCIIDICISVK